MSSSVCKHCGCADIERDTSQGNAVCTSCGSVLEDQIIVSEIQFQENAGGSSSVIGQFVSAEGGVKSSSFGGTYHRSYGRESRELTLEKGRRRIQQLANQLRINQNYIDIAYNFFKMAVSKNLTKGRISLHVSAACLYLVCRTEGTEHMLLDFADATQVPVYVLGHTYLQLAKALCLNIKPIDPCLYIPRFANKLQLGDKEHHVSTTAVRLVSRMKRDWMAQGRRPSGLCGAALLVAARIHNFNRTVKDVLKVVKIGEGTLWKRLAELEQTASGHLTIDEFDIQKIDLEEEMDPPSFTEGKRKAKLLQLEEEGRLPFYTAEVVKLQQEIDSALEAAAAKKKRVKGIDDDIGDDSNLTITDNDADVELASCQQFVDAEIVQEIEASVRPMHSECAEDIDTDLTVKRLEEEEFRQVTSDCVAGLGPRPTAALLGLKESVEECLRVPTEKEAAHEDGELDLSGIDDSELDQLILNKDEIRRKAVLWVRENADYLKEQKLKAEKEAQERAENANKTDKKKKPRKKKQPKTEASTAGEAIERMLIEKKISSKINYDVLRDLSKKPEEIEQANKAESVNSSVSHVMPDAVKQEDNRLKRSRNQASQPAFKKLKLEEKEMKSNILVTMPQAASIVVESGPVEYANDDDADEDIEDEDHFSAARLLANADNDYEDNYGYNEDVD